MPDKFFTDKTILITGGTGSVGTGIVRSLLADQPRVIRIFSRDEAKQWELQHEFQDLPNIRFLLGDVRDRDRVMRAMEDVDIVFHCAAMKHVPSSEYNPFEAVKTNVLGTENIVEAAIASNVSHVVATSSDKAISPTNAMGATKLLAERLISAADQMRGKHRTLFSAVRFGNVIGSRGSVVPAFINQILRDRTIRVTDPEMTRFMMTLSEAVSLTKQSLMMSRGGETFVLKMPVIRLGDLAHVVADLAAERLGIRRSEIKLELVGARAGEKQYEELMTYEESKVAMEYAGLFLVPPVITDRPRTYEGAAPAKVGPYSSEDYEPITREEVYRLLDREQVVQQLVGRIGRIA